MARPQTMWTWTSRTKMRACCIRECLESSLQHPLIQHRVAMRQVCFRNQMARIGTWIFYRYAHVQIRGVCQMCKKCVEVVIFDSCRIACIYNQHKTDNSLGVENYSKMDTVTFRINNKLIAILFDTFQRLLILPVSQT